MPGWRVAKAWMLPLVTLALVGGGLARFVGQESLATQFWTTGTAVVFAVLVIDIGIGLHRKDFGLDLIAALAMGGAILFGEYLAGIVVALMFTGGQFLENFAQNRASREMTALLSRVPTRAARYQDSRIEDVAVSAIAPGDLVLVRRGEVVPVDGIVEGNLAVLDESALTGEALPIRRQSGQAVMSGSTNAGDAFDLKATSAAADSTYAGVIRLVEAAQRTKAPIVRLAAKFGLAFLALTLSIAASAWALTGEATRALAVIVVATPCPLILAVPVAIVSGISRCAKKGVLVKDGGALEALAAARTVLLDKTGTVTDGRARLIEIKARGDLDPLDLLRVAASLDQSSPHVVAQALVAAARERGLRLDVPSGVRETAGSGLTGRVAGREVVVGGWAFASTGIEDSDFRREIEAWIRRDGTVAVVVTIDGALAGAMLLADQIRPEAGYVLRHLRETGIARIVLVTGDRADLAAGVGAFLGVDDVISEMKPEDKTNAVDKERVRGRPVLMIGDGVNDAPALAAADVGIAMGARGAAASSEAADVVILVDRLDRLVGALHIARRSRAIALQSVYAGMALSVAGMIAAALGYLTPVEGALFQEAIDVAVILNALRALGPPVSFAMASPRLSNEDLQRLEAEHKALADVVDDIGMTADRIARLPQEEAIDELQRLDRGLRDRLLPHEKRDEQVYARLRQKNAKPDILAGMSRTHMEIQRQIHNLTVMRKAFDGKAPTEAQLHEVQRLLHGLEAITRLHFAQEEEIYRSLEVE
ncbi:heavy metal translocating P-type ATPase [Rhizobium bangladeshense]|nr:heavy metal translocating P-type ATPase [Rhizobium bangladeshense]MBX5215941.1 heavy metal translocating P-type ATPase [Rhizobium sp. NLR9a]MBX5234318.1 heavy metal translocating P-type ATPase [Rhizobium sp. NLR4a]MBX5246639.1 heavy metal translocating P-type ATPase [Rhizobium sp. NLR3b]MBX5251320.1 heavy metal translocating P-type ATPase [Rhizobium sp. NLR4b]MBX5257938.1 heavy metal translocating P-type ATPase [Rhizobium sp. NLR16b]MBX5264031.1 heavy metal translocating P-type ATPase [Rhi